MLLRKAHSKYQKLGGKERTKRYYLENKEKIKKKERLKYLFLPESDKEIVRQRSLKRFYKNKNK